MSNSTPQTPERPLDRAVRSPHHSTAVRHALVLGLLATLLCLIGSGAASLWTDEAATISAARRSWPELWGLLHNIDAVHGLYYAFIHLWGEAFGYSPVALRLPSALAVGLAAAGLYLFTGPLAGRHVALAATLVFAVLPRTTWMGMEGRSFALSTAVVVWLSVLLSAAARTRGRNRHVLFGLYALLAALGTWLNIYVALAVAAHGLALLLLRRIPRPVVTGWAAASVVAAGLAGPVVLVAALQSGQLGIPDLSPGILARSLVVDQWFLGETPTNPYLPSTGLQLWQPASVLLAAVGWILVLAALLGPGPHARGGQRPGPGSGRVLFRCAVPMLLLPTIVLMGFSLLAAPIYNARYLSFATPALALLIGLGLTRLPRRWERITAGALLVALALPVYVSQRQPDGKSGSDWAQVAAHVAEESDDGDAVYFGPRRTPTGTDVGQTQRRIATAYPHAFAGLQDVSLKYPGTRDDSLDGRSRLLQDCGPELHGVETVWLVRRKDYPAGLLAAEDRWVMSQGFLSISQWTGNTNTVTGFSRPPAG